MVSSFNRVAADEMSVLVVDDHPSMRDMLVTSLRRRGCRCDAAEGGHGALQMLSTTSFNIVLLDLWMEDLTGLEVLRQIRSTDPSQRVVMMSANADEEDRHEAKVHGVRHFLDKPIEISELWRTLLIERNLSQRSPYASEWVHRAC